MPATYRDFGDDPFPTLVVGSLPRPLWVRDLVEDRKAGGISPEEAGEMLDHAIPSAIRMQERAGLDYVSDGEWRRESYVKVFAEAVDGFEHDLLMAGTGGRTPVLTYPAVVRRMEQKALPCRRRGGVPAQPHLVQDHRGDPVALHRRVQAVERRALGGGIRNPWRVHGRLHSHHPGRGAAPSQPRRGRHPDRRAVARAARRPRLQGARRGHRHRPRDRAVGQVRERGCRRRGGRADQCAPLPCPLRTEARHVRPLRHHHGRAGRDAGRALRDGVRDARRGRHRFPEGLPRRQGAGARRHRPHRHARRRRRRRSCSGRRRR